MNKLIFILLLVCSSMFGQLDTIDLSITDFGVPANDRPPDFVRTEMYKVNIGLTELDTILDPPHLFIYFEDSTISKSYTTSWAQLTNAGADMYIQSELEGFTMSNDTITATYGGDYNFNASFTHDGDNLETVSIRFYNVTKTAEIPVAGANTMRAANNFMSTSVTAYGEVDASDEIVVEYKGDASGTSVFKHGAVNILRIHGN